MNLIDADKFLSYLIFSKHIDSLTCREVKEAVEMCKVDAFNKIREEIESIENYATKNGHDIWVRSPDEIKKDVLAILDKYKLESDRIGTGELYPGEFEAMEHNGRLDALEEVVRESNCHDNFEQTISQSFLFGMAFGFASKYDEKGNILKAIREMIDDKEDKK